VPAKRIFVQCFYVSNKLGPNRIKVNIPYKFQQIDIFLAENRFACPVKLNDIFIGAICFIRMNLKKDLLAETI